MSRIRICVAEGRGGGGLLGSVLRFWLKGMGMGLAGDVRYEGCGCEVDFMARDESVGI